MPHDWRALASIQTLAAVQYFPIVGFNNERRNHTEHDQYPRDQTSIPEESVDHEPLLSSPGWVSLREKYSRQKSWRAGGREDAVSDRRKVVSNRATLTMSHSILRLILSRRLR